MSDPKDKQPEVKIVYTSPIDETLSLVGLTNRDVELSIKLALDLRKAVRAHRITTREAAVSSSESEEQQNKRVKMEEAEDDRTFYGAALFLAQKMKPPKNVKPGRRSTKK
jgi:hypothetical protein